MFEILTPDLARTSVLALAALFLAVTFLQSGADKVLDFQGNLGWMTPHFAKSPFAGVVPLLLGILTALELATGLLCAAGIAALLAGRGGALAGLGLLLGGLTFCALLLGQRLAKDYAGAAGLVPYFLVTLAGLLARGA